MGGLAKWSSLAASTGRGSAAFHGVVYNRAALLVAEASCGALALLLRPPWRSGAATALIVGAAVVGTVVLAYQPRAGVALDRLVAFSGSLLVAAVGAVCQALIAAGVLRWRGEAAPGATLPAEP